MIKRTTIELDYDLLTRAQAVLHCPTARATIHEALRRAIDAPDGADAASLRNQYFDLLAESGDLTLLETDAAWR